MDGAGQNIEIDPAAIHVWCDLVLGYLDGSVTVRLISEKGTPDQKPMTRFFSVADVSAKIAALAANAARNRRAVFIVPGTVKTAGTARAEDIRETGVILADLDEGDIEAKRSHLVRHLGEPSMEVASGGKTAEGQLKRHLFWRLTEAAAGDDLALVADLRQTLARKTGGDPSFASLHQPIRVAGTVHGKQGVQAPVRILARNACEYELADFADAVRTMPAMPGVKQEADPRPRKHYGVSASELMSRPIREGGQDDETRFGALSKVIGHWLRQVRSGRMSLHEAWIAVVNHNTALIRPPWDENRLRRDFEALLQRDIRDKGPMPEPTPVMEPSIEGAGVLPPEQSEDALATRFVGCHGANWKEVAAWGAWLRWTGTHWSRDEVGAVFQDIRLICRTEASGIDKPAEARRLASSKTIQAVQKIAAHDPSIARAPDDFDQHPMLLNTPGGILDLQTGALAPHDRGLLITQITQARPGQGCPIWIGFLETATGGDGELQAYLARVAGYSLTGSTKEQTFFFLHGLGANGKSVFLQTLAWVLGDYAATAAADTFTSRVSTRHLTELAGLRGARLVLVSETDAGEGWAEARIKSVTGGEKIRANYMYRDHFEFVPQFKLVVAGNHRPSLGDVGEAMRRRLHIIPFTVTIPPEERIPDLAERLKGEADAILGWMIDGCADWLAKGLMPPATVLAAGQDYFESEDQFGQWLGECCSVGIERRATARVLFASWSDWAKVNGFEPRTTKVLGEQLRARGFRHCKVGTDRGWLGLGLRKPLRNGEGT